MDPTSPADRTAEAFARHGARLRRLARGLLYECADADDLVQSAWLAVLRREPDRSASHGAFLAGVVRRIASQSAREAARRERREREAARPEAGADPVSALERLELTQLLVEAVRALDEPYRSTLLLRFFENCSMRGIAKRRGVPLETARTHLKRGLELVRRRLDRRGPGGRDELLAALVPLAGPTSGALPLSGPEAGRAVLEGAGAIMSSKLGLALAGVVVAALALWTIDATGGARDGDAGAAAERALALDAPAPVEGSTSASQVPPAAVEMAEVAQAASERTSAGDDAFVVRGRALVDDAPLANARVELRLYAGPEASGEPLQSAHVEADDDGRFRWELAPPADVVTLWGRIALDDHHGWPSTLTVLAGEPAPDALDVHAYPLDCTLAGRVHDGAGVPIAGVRVSAQAGASTSGADGTYELALSSRIASTYVEASAPGWAQQRHVVEKPRAGDRVTIDFELRREFRVFGRVEDESGRPIAGAQVSSFFTRGNEATSALDGSYTLHCLDPGRPEHMLTARKEGYVRSTETVEVRGREEAELVLALPRGARVEGRVVGPDREPLAGAELYIGFSPAAYDRLDARSDADGRFSFPAVGRGGQTLVTQRKGFAPDSRELSVPGSGKVLGGIEIELSTGSFLGGRVIDSSGEPVPSVWISARHRGEYIDVREQSDEDGRFRLEHLPGEQVGIELYGAGIVRRELDTPVLGVDDLVVQVERAARVAGTVVDGVTGVPLASFRIRFVAPSLMDGETNTASYSATWAREGHRFTGSDGRWDSGDEELAPGAVLGIEASAPGYGPSIAERAVASVEADPAALVIALWPEQIVRGTIVSAASGEPVSGAIVKRFTEREPLDHHDSDDVHRRLFTRSDAHGRFELRGVPAGEMSLAIEHEEQGVAIDGPFEVPREGELAERRIVLGSSSRVHGRALDADGRALAGATIELEARSRPGLAGIRLEVRTDATGAFAFERVAPGKYELAHVLGSVPGGRVKGLVRFVELDADDDLEADLRPMGSASVTGGLDCDGSLPGDFAISARRSDADLAEMPDARAHGTLCDEGRFELRGLAAGEYDLVASYFDAGTTSHWMGHARVRIAEGERAEVWIRVAAVR